MEANTTEYLTVEADVVSETIITQEDSELFDLPSNPAKPLLDIIFTLADTRYKYERAPYTFFILLGDFGGFQGAIIILPGYLMSLYTSRMFQS